MSNPVLVVNADDFALTRDISEGICVAHHDGIVTSTSVIAAGDGLERDADLLRGAPDLAVGAHLTLVGAIVPCLPAREVPSLVDHRGRFLPSWRHFLRRWLMGRLRVRDVTRELAAQIERVGDVRGALTHVDSHQHLHLLPIVRDVVIELACAAGIRCIRRPRSSGARLAGPCLERLGRALDAEVRRARLRTTERSVGFDEAGRFDATRWRDALTQTARVRPMSVEAFVHPALGPDRRRGALGWGYRWEDELHVLTSGWLRARILADGYRLGTWRDVPP